MKQVLILFTCLYVFMFFGNAQKVYPGYVDGKICFKIKTTEPITFRVEKGDQISISEFSFMEGWKETFGITTLTRPLTLFDDPDLMRYIFVKFDSVYKVDELIKFLSAVSIIENVEKEPIVVTHSTPPNDPYYGTVRSRNLKWYLDMINAECAWSIAEGSPSIRVAVVDNAVWGNHPDLQIPSNLQCNATTNPVTVGNAAPPLSINPSQYCTNTINCLSYDWSHGTHCAGLVGAITNNGTGIASIGHGVTLMGVRCKVEGGEFLDSEAILRGVQWAVVNKAKVISMSYGSATPYEAARVLYQKCYDSSIVLVASAGNDGDRGNPINYPAGYSSVISVASVDYNHKLSYFSEYGDWVDIAAPGGFEQGQDPTKAVLSSTFCKNVQVQNYSEFVGQYYDFMQGTSMSCPVAAGLCGLMLSRNPNLHPDTVKAILQQTAQPLAAGSNPINSNSGIIDACAAMKRVDAMVPRAGFISDVTSINAGGIVNFSDTTHAIPVAISSRTWSFPGGTPATSTDLTPAVTYNIPGIYSAKLVVRDASNQKDSVLKENYINVAVPATPVDQLSTDKNSLNIKFYNTAQNTFNIISNATWNITNDSPLWLDIDVVSGTGNKIITVKALSENTTVQPRTATITVAGGSTSIPITITQEKGLPVLDVNVTEVEIDGEALYPISNVRVTNANVVWTVTGVPAWLTIDPSGLQTGDQSITITATPNTTGFPRTANLLIKDTATTVVRQVVVNQIVPPVSLFVDPTSLTLGDQGSSGTFYISSTSSWAIYEKPSWASLSQENGDGNVEIRVTATQNNTTGSVRSRTIEILAGSGTSIVKKYVTIRQDPFSSISPVEKEVEMFRIYPNPFTNIVYLENNSPGLIKEIAVLNLTGRMLFTQVIKETSKKITIDMNTYPQGIYLLKIITANGKSQYKKLIKQ